MPRQIVAPIQTSTLFRLRHASIFGMKYNIHSEEYPIDYQRPSTIIREHSLHMKNRESLRHFYKSITTYEWRKQDANVLILVSLPNQTRPDRAHPRYFRKEREDVPFTIQNQNSGNNRTLNVGVQPTERNHFHTVHTSDPIDGETRNKNIIMNILGEENVWVSTRYFNQTQPPRNFDALVTTGVNSQSQKPPQWGWSTLVILTHFIMTG